MTTAGRDTALLLPAVLVVAMGLVLAGCPKQPEVGETKPAGPVVASAPPRPAAGTGATDTRVTPPPVPRETTTTAAPTPRPGPGAPGGPGEATASPLKDIFFDYDKALLTDDTKRILNENLAWLRGNPRAQITVEGHCDERGTTEYNLALGERRAKAVREYLAAVGIAADRIKIISYGKERPFVLGHDESAWKWNRRGHFLLAR